MAIKTKRNFVAAKNGGFTLTELMLAVTILAILSSILVPKMSALILKAKEAAVKGKWSGLKAAIDIYSADNEGTYPTDLQALVGKYIEKIPTIEIPGNSFANNPGHEPLNGVDYQSTDQVEDWNDDAAWSYVSSGPSWGTLYINCCHKTADGSRWSGAAPIAAWASCP